jgi:hypothetical protein
VAAVQLDPIPGMAPERHAEYLHFLRETALWHYRARQVCQLFPGLSWMEARTLLIPQLESYLTTPLAPQPDGAPPPGPRGP